MKIPLVDLRSQMAEVADEIRAGLADVFDSASFIGGPVVGRFECAYANAIGVDHCIGVANGTDALELALRASGVEPGYEVILPVNTFIATAEAVSRIGAIPVLVDVDPEYQLIDPAAVQAAASSRTAAIIAVHLFGQVAPVERLIEVAAHLGVPLIEDAAQAQGARRHGRAAGSFGLAAGTSFYPGKNLGGAGDGGAVTTDDPDVARTVRMLAAHGSEQKYEHEVVGFNSRLDSVQAVVLEAKLLRLEDWNMRRRELAETYNRLLSDVDAIQTPRSAAGNEDVWHLYVVQLNERDRALRSLNAAGVGAAIHYPTPLHLTRAYAHLRLGRGAFPVAEAAADRILSLPIYPHLERGQQERVVGALLEAVR